MRRLPVFLFILSLLDISLAGNIGIGIGFGRSSRPYDQALRDLKSKRFTQLKTWSINPAWLEQAKRVYSQVYFFYLLPQYKENKILFVLIYR